MGQATHAAVSEYIIFTQSARAADRFAHEIGGVLTRLAALAAADRQGVGGVPEGQPCATASHSITIAEDAMGLGTNESRFHHRWATVIWPEQPWYRRSLNRCVDVRVTDQGLSLQVIRPWNLLTLGLSRQAGKGFEEPIAQAQIEGLEQAKYAGFPTVRVRYLDSSGRRFQLEISFTHFSPIPLVSDRGAEFIAALTR